MDTIVKRKKNHYGYFVQVRMHSAYAIRREFVSEALRKVVKMATFPRMDGKENQGKGRVRTSSGIRVVRLGFDEGAIY